MCDVLILSVYMLSVESFVAREICRLRWNWFYLILASPLMFISYSSIMSSFHQFVSNPTAQQLNGTEMEDRVNLVYECHIAYWLVSSSHHAM